MAKSVPLSTWTNCWLSKPGTASLKVMVTVEVWPTLRAVEDSAICAVGTLVSTA